jgi:hypothetical protein
MLDHFQLIQNQHQNIMMKINLLYEYFVFLEDEFLLYRLDIMRNQLQIQQLILPLQNFYIYLFK